MSTTVTVSCNSYLSNHTREMQAAKAKYEQTGGQCKVKAELNLQDLTRCAACYNSVTRHIDKDESSSSEGSGPEADCEFSSCSSSETDFENLWTQDTSANYTVAPGQADLKSGEPESDKTETPERSTNRRAVFVPADSVLLESQSPRVVSVLNLQVLPPRHTYDPHYIIRRCPSDIGPSVPDERRESDPAVPEQQPLQCSVHRPQQLSAPAAHGVALPFFPLYSGPQVYGPYGPLHSSRSIQYQPSEPQQ